MQSKGYMQERVSEERLLNNWKIHVFASKTHSIACIFKYWPKIYDSCITHNRLTRRSLDNDWRRRRRERQGTFFLQQSILSLT
jgi:hypothetical protein